VTIHLHHIHLYPFIQTFRTRRLQSNEIIPAKAQYLTNMLHHNRVRLLYHLLQTLTILDLRLNGIRNEGVEHLADALHLNKVKLSFYECLSYTSESHNVDTHQIGFTIQLYL